MSETRDDKSAIVRKREEFLSWAKAAQGRLRGRKFEDSTGIIREDRDSDHATAV